MILGLVSTYMFSLLVSNHYHQVGLDQFYHPVVQFAEDGANYR